MKKHLKGLTILIAIAVFLTAYSSPLFASSTAVDPTYIGVGARALGMGKAYVAIAQGPDTIFNNPAGLAAIRDFEVTSMHASLLNEIHYTLAGGTHPVEGGTWGFGLLTSGVGNIPLFSGSPPGGHFPTPDLGYTSFYNNIINISYGMPAEGLADVFPAMHRLQPHLRNMAVGFNLKYFLQGSTTNGSGSGFDLDLGYLYYPAPWFSLGIVAQNVFPAASTFPLGKISWGNNVDEGIPSILKVGTEFGLMGPKGALIRNDEELILGMDIDIYPGKERPATGHIGLEYWLTKTFAIRGGFDQDPVPPTVSPIGTETNLTLGCGLISNGFAFDYAYHQYNNLPENASHFFSISYVGEEEEDVEMISLYNPPDKYITSNKTIKVQGKVHREAQDVTINGNPIEVDEEGEFEIDLTLKTVGRKKITAMAEDTLSGKKQRVTRRVLRLASFKDVVTGYWAKDQIEYIGTLGLVGGYPDGTFRPDRALSRAELATLLVRAKGVKLPLVTKRVFKDIPKGHWAERYIKAAVDMGLVTGYPDGTYKPAKKINRAEGVALLTRFDGITTAQVLQEAPFADVSPRYWAATTIAAAKTKGLLQYLGEAESFQPGKDLTRSETVEILSKTGFGKTKIAKLFDWDSEE